MTYLWDDLVALYRIISKKLRKDRNYYKKLKIRYERDWKKAKIIFKKIDGSRLSKLSVSSLFLLARKASHAIALSVGVGHMIEPYAIAGDKRIRKAVEDSISDPKLATQVFLSSTTPKTKSFASVAEDRVHFLAQKESVHDSEIAKFISDFFWIQNTYSGRRPLAVSDVRKMILEYKEQTKNLSEKQVERVSISKNSFKLPEFLEFELETLSFLSVWQDERKRNILIAIDYLERILEVISEKIKISITLLRYLEPSELTADCINMESVLKERREGVVFLQSDKGIEFGLKGAYEQFNKILNADKNVHETELRGTSASVGKVIGRVKVCKTPDSISKVEDGDVLVASMTRPEYLPAMRKASAFVTDEGGITCHAAIVAREMGKPCVIGTRFATRFLKDGDLVEVKGNHGVVIVLKRSF